MKELNQLQDFLDQNEIPKSKKRPKTFLGIAKQPHYENVLSNMYAFFFDENEVHGFKDLFTTSLMQLIEQKTQNKLLFQWNNKNFSQFQNFIPRTEVNTGNGRIDLLLDNGEQAIIIENKVYHHLNNDLQDYWNSIEYNDEFKIGIVLSLQPIPFIQYDKFESSPHYINVTHLELVNQIEKNIGSYLLDANHKYQIFLTDFIQNIINMSTPVLTSKEIAFYFENQEKINDVVSFKKNLRDHIIAEVEKANTILEVFNYNAPRVNSFNDKRARYFVSPNHPNLMIVVVFANMVDENKNGTMHIAVELTNSLLKDREQYRSIKFTPEEEEIAFCEHFTSTNESWSHFAVKHYHPTNAEIANLGEFVADWIRDDHLLSIYHKIDSYLTEKKNKG
ncbi:PD-(D/E)XK nuclease family protein [Nonlabens antarcticus]|uniref:PD-(D/E)XK nuclease family protein n=1 Tax=Nonlabens antarcticus TaxID=392714 RepID=UPI0018917FBF|nr:PD-(D/E)XK nuclease family protein [Nonlabens antarcticus]